MSDRTREWKLAESMNELTFVAKLGVATALRHRAAKDAGRPVRIAEGNIEESQKDGSGRVKRCDMRLASASGRKLVSGEMKRPEVAEGRDPRNRNLVDDARRKAVNRGLPLYFTCNMAEVVLWEVSIHGADKELISFELAPISQSGEVEAYWNDIQDNWGRFLDDVERRLSALETARPAPTSADVIQLQGTIIKIAKEVVGRAERYLIANPSELEKTREESSRTFGHPFPLNPTLKADFRQDLEQVLRLAAFVVAQKLILYRVLAVSGKLLPSPFTLDPVSIASDCTDPIIAKMTIDRAVSAAITRSGDFETAFLPTPNESLLFLEPATKDEITECRVGEVWASLLTAIDGVSWSVISHNLVGFLYEAIVDPDHRHELGQHYTQENVVDFLTAFAIRDHADLVLDPAAGGGSFLASAYSRKKAMGATHSDALAEVWGCELSSFAAELTTVTLATADPNAPSAYPRVLLMDFFEMRPGMRTALEIPGLPGKLKVPKGFDAVVGNPPYISYRHQTNQETVLKAFDDFPNALALPKMSGKSDEFAWFLVHATRFLKEGGRLGFVVSSGILFSDYGIPLIRFLARHFKILAVVDSMVERWFIDADVNTVLLLLERESKSEEREPNQIRFIRFRRPLAQLIPAPLTIERRDGLENLIELVLECPLGDEDPRLTCVVVDQGRDGGLFFSNDGVDDDPQMLEEEE